LPKGIAPAQIDAVPHVNNRGIDWRRPAVAGLMALVLLLVGLLASSERIHSWLHTDSPSTHGSCAVCALVKGQLDAPAVSPSFAVALIPLSGIVPVLESAPTPAVDFSAATSRGPPTPASSQ